jgi:hypothetical protein
MATVTQKFFSLEVTISDDRTPIIELNQLAYATLTSLIPAARKEIDEERKQMLQAQAENESDEGEEECPYQKEKADQDKVNELYV